MTFLCEIKLTPDSAPQAGPKDTPVKSNTNVLVRGALTYLSCSRREAFCGGRLPSVREDDKVTGRRGPRVGTGGAMKRRRGQVGSSADFPKPPPSTPFTAGAGKGNSELHPAVAVGQGRRESTLCLTVRDRQPGTASCVSLLLS